LVYVGLRRYGPRLRRLSVSSREEDLPWEDLLEQLRARQRELAASGTPIDEDLPPEQFLALLLAQLPDGSIGRRPEVTAEERHFLESGGAECRAGSRRWGNPTEVYLHSYLLPSRLHGMVINRSTGGLGIFVDQKIQPGTLITVRSTEAPAYVPWVSVEVKHCSKVRGHYIIGCQFRSEIPWNIRVWFG
jgi:hypothetical protein